MCTFVTTGPWRVKQVVDRFMPVRRPCEAQIKAAAELAPTKKISVARGGMDNSGAFRKPPARSRGAETVASGRRLTELPLHHAGVVQSVNHAAQIMARE